MEILSIVETEKCPKVLFNKKEGIFQIIGRSVPEDAQKFYIPIIEWLDEYLLDPNEKTVLHFELDYFNTASSMMLLAIFLKVKPIHSAEDKEILIQWHFDEEDMQDAGVDFEEASNIPFEQIGEVDDEF